MSKILCHDVGRGEDDAPRFAPASAAEDRREVFDEEQCASVRIEHYVPAPA